MIASLSTGAELRICMAWIGIVANCAAALHIWRKRYRQPRGWYRVALELAESSNRNSESAKPKCRTHSPPQLGKGVRHMNRDIAYWPNSCVL